MIILYWFLVQRRIGGLENVLRETGIGVGVQRRIGGLESCTGNRSAKILVQRRIGGLEKHRLH